MSKSEKMFRFCVQRYCGDMRVKNNTKPLHIVHTLKRYQFAKVLLLSSCFEDIILFAYNQNYIY